MKRLGDINKGAAGFDGKKPREDELRSRISSSKTKIISVIGRRYDDVIFAYMQELLQWLHYKDHKMALLIVPYSLPSMLEDDFHTVNWHLFGSTLLPPSCNTIHVSFHRGGGGAGEYANYHARKSFNMNLLRQRPKDYYGTGDASVQSSETGKIDLGNMPHWPFSNKLPLEKSCGLYAGGLEFHADIAKNCPELFDDSEEQRQYISHTQDDWRHEVLSRELHVIQQTIRAQYHAMDWFSGSHCQRFESWCTENNVVMTVKELSLEISSAVGLFRRYATTTTGKFCKVIEFQLPEK